MNIEDVFSSKLRMKILKVLHNVGELNVSEIARRLNINYMSASKHMKILEDENIHNTNTSEESASTGSTKNPPRQKQCKTLLTHGNTKTTSRKEETK